MNINEIAVFDLEYCCAQNFSDQIYCNYTGLMNVNNGLSESCLKLKALPLKQLKDG